MTEQERKRAVEAGLIYPEAEKKCGNTCSDKCIPFYDHQHTMMHYNWVNRRSMIQLIAVCVMAIIVVFIFTTNQTQREKMWQEAMVTMQEKHERMWTETVNSIYGNTATGAEVDHGQQDTDH